MIKIATVLKDFANFTGKHVCRNPILVKLQAWLPATLSKRDWTLLRNLRIFLRISSFYKTPLAAASALISSTHAYWIKLICRDSGTGIFLSILKNFLKYYWSPLVTASFCHMKRNIKINYGSYTQWAHCLMVSIVSKTTVFYLLQRYI